MIDFQRKEATTFRNNFMIYKKLSRICEIRGSKRMQLRVIESSYFRR
jgi:hypothetical protein